LVKSRLLLTSFHKNPKGSKVGLYLFIYFDSLALQKRMNGMHEI